MEGVFCKLAKEDGRPVGRSAKPSFKPESGALVVVAWAVSGCICSILGRGSVFGVFRCDSLVICSWTSSWVAGVLRTSSMDGLGPASGVSSRSMRDPSCGVDRGVFLTGERCDDISKFELQR